MWTVAVAIVSQRDRESYKETEEVSKDRPLLVGSGPRISACVVDTGLSLKSLQMATTTMSTVNPQPYAIKTTSTGVYSLVQT